MIILSAVILLLATIDKWVLSNRRADLEIEEISVKPFCASSDLSQAQKFRGQSTPRIVFKFERILKFPVV